MPRVANGQLCLTSKEFVRSVQRDEIAKRILGLERPGDGPRRQETGDVVAFAAVELNSARDTCLVLWPTGETVIQGVLDI